MFNPDTEYLKISKGAEYGVRTVLGSRDHRGTSIEDIVQTVLMECWRCLVPIHFPFAKGKSLGRRRALDVVLRTPNAIEFSASTAIIEESLSTKEYAPERRLVTDEMLDSICSTVCEEDWFILKVRSEGMTYAEIGDTLDKPSTTVGDRYRKLLNRLKEEYGDDYQDA